MLGSHWSLFPGHSKPARYPPCTASRSTLKCCHHKPAICKAGASGRERTCLRKMRPKRPLDSGGVLPHSSILPRRSVRQRCVNTAPSLVPLKLQFLRMKKRQISFLSASVKGGEELTEAAAGLDLLGTTAVRGNIMGETFYSDCHPAEKGNFLFQVFQIPGAAAAGALVP